MSDAGQTLAADVVTAADLAAVAEMFGRPPAAAPWPSSTAVLALAVELLPTVADDIEGDLVERLAFAMVDRDDELAAVRATLAAALSHGHAQDIEIRRLRRRLADLLDAGRRDRAAA